MGRRKEKTGKEKGWEGAKLWREWGRWQTQCWSDQENNSKLTHLTPSSVSFGTLGDDLASLSLNVLIRKGCLTMLFVSIFLTSEAVRWPSEGLWSVAGQVSTSCSCCSLRSRWRGLTVPCIRSSLEPSLAPAKQQTGESKRSITVFMETVNNDYSLRPVLSMMTRQGCVITFFCGWKTWMLGGTTPWGWEEACIPRCYSVQWDKFKLSSTALPGTTFDPLRAYLFIVYSYSEKWVFWFSLIENPRKRV